MIKVNFYDADKIHDDLLEYAVIVSKYNNEWVFCRHIERNTFEVPGGRREANEDIDSTAKRELYEETGAISYSISKVCAYSVTGTDNVISNEKETFGMLYFADINEFSPLPDFEIAEIQMFKNIPANLTYPFIQPILIDKVQGSLAE